ERIRVNGQMIPEEAVLRFINEHRRLVEEIQPSFFETTVAMAFDYFAQEQVDIAVIEVGLGGRLDSTNIIHPELCVITNIGMDHTDQLGDTLIQIAGEKAGIIKSEVPVIVSERDESIAHVFERKAEEQKAPLRFASEELQVLSSARKERGLQLTVSDYVHQETIEIYVGLAGRYQQKNMLGVLT